MDADKSKEPRARTKDLAHDRIRTMSDENLVYFADKPRREALHAAAYDAVGRGMEETTVADLQLKLAIMRALLKLDHRVWWDKWIGHVLFGSESPNNASSSLNHVIHRRKPLSAVTASMLAQFANYFLDAPTAFSVEDGFAPEDRVRIVSEWIAEGIRMDGWMVATDFTGDLLSFTRKLARLTGEETEHAISPQLEATIHDRIVAVLTEPMTIADWRHRLIIQPYRPLPPEQERTRFGAEQLPGGDPRQWEAQEFKVGEVIEYGLPITPDVPMKAWLVTIRNPRPSDPVGRRFSGRWVWEEPWENLIRWLSPFTVQQGTSLRAPTGSSHSIQPLTGLFTRFCSPSPITQTPWRAVSQPLRGKAPISRANWIICPSRS
jgi:hypothetical protein